MTARVNLLQPGEMRRQGAINPAFMFRALALIGAVALVMLGALALLQYRNARQRLFIARELWKAREPLYKRVQAMKADLATKRKLDLELQGWSASRIEWNVPLRTLQEIVPPVIQLRRLDVRGDLEIRTLKTKAAGKGEARKPEGVPAEPLAGVPGRRFFLLIEGCAFGEQAELAVLQFDGALRQSAAFRALLESLRLQKVQAERDGAEGQGRRTFTIEAATGRREMP